MAKSLYRKSSPISDLNVANMSLTLFAKIKFSWKFPNLQYMYLLLGLNPSFSVIMQLCTFDAIYIQLLPLYEDNATIVKAIFLALDRRNTITQGQ